MLNIIKMFEAKEGQNPLLWIWEVETAMSAAKLKPEQQQVVMAISKSGGSAREWALTWDVSVDAVFFTWIRLKANASDIRTA